jgi:tetratricopeptide (TPR) repeat protein
VVPQILLQGVALSCGVLYLYLSRWRPDRGAFRIAALSLSALLLAGFGGAEVRGRRLEAREGDLERAWTSRPPEPGEVDSLLAAIRVTRPDAAGDVLARASRAALRHGRQVAARDWAELALAEAPESGLPWLARAEVAAAQGETPEVRDALRRLVAFLPGAGGPPAGLAFLPRTTAIAVAIELLDAGRPAGALDWIEAAEGTPGGAARLLDAECRLRLGKPEEAERTLGDLLERSPENVEVLLAVTRARLARGDRQGAWRSLRRAAAAGAPRPLVLPLTAALGPPDDEEAGEARAALAAGIVIVARDEWPDRHPNGNFLDGSAEDRRVPLLLQPGRAYELLVEARGTAARGEAPRLRVEASGRRLAELPVGRDWATYRVRLTPGTAMTTVRLSFPNDFFDPAGADRNLVVGTVRLQDASLLS